MVQWFLVFNSINDFAEFLVILGREIPQEIRQFLNLMLDFFGIFNNHLARVSGKFQARIFRSLVQFPQVTVVGGIKVFLNVNKVHHIAVFEIFIWTIDTSQRLQQIVTIEFAAKIQLFQTVCVKTRKQHFIDNQKVRRHVLLVVNNVFLAFLLVSFIMENQGRLQRFFKERSVVMHQLFCRHVCDFFSLFLNDA